MSLAKFWKNYLKIGGLDNKSKALYLALILDLRIRKEGLYSISLTSDIITNIYNKLQTDYTM